MSLRAFHLFFILASISLAGLVGVWAMKTQPQGAFLFTVASFAIGVLLIVYLFWFLNKIKKLPR